VAGFARRISTSSKVTNSRLGWTLINRSKAALAGMSATLAVILPGSGSSGPTTTFNSPAAAMRCTASTNGRSTNSMVMVVSVAPRDAALSSRQTTSSDPARIDYPPPPAAALGDVYPLFAS